jgi:hypothetical protein
VSFTVIIADPCETTTINDIVFAGSAYSAGVLSVTDGATDAVIFSRPTTASEDSNGVVEVCGVTTYSIHNDQANGLFSYNAAWAAITESSGTYTLTIDTTQDLSLIAEESSVDHVMYIKSTLTDYTSFTREKYTAITIRINSGSCDCSALAWVDPTNSIIDATWYQVSGGAQTLSFQAPLSDTSARSTNAVFDKCYHTGGPGCAETGTFSSI